MDIRAVGRDLFGGRLLRIIGALNSRHPWSHNDYFHSWILAELPEGRRNAVDVGCGRGELLAFLAERFDDVHGTDSDETMRQLASTRCAGLPNVTVGAAPPDAAARPVDLVTMIAVLHHLDVERTLADVRRMLNPGGRFLCVGLARPVSTVDQLWDVASMVTNPIIGFVRHPWVSRDTASTPPFPVQDSQLTFDELRRIVERVLPGARMSHRVGFRHTIEWTKPPSPSGDG